MTSEPEEIHYLCTYCFAGPGDPCSTLLGFKPYALSYFHQSRIEWTATMRARVRRIQEDRELVEALLRAEGARAYV